jgi:hypothetical protein
LTSSSNKAGTASKAKWVLNVFIPPNKAFLCADSKILTFTGKTSQKIIAVKKINLLQKLLVLFWIYLFYVNFVSTVRTYLFNMQRSKMLIINIDPTLLTSLCGKNVRAKTFCI